MGTSDLEDFKILLQRQEKSLREIADVRTSDKAQYSKRLKTEVT